jgi:hypothetical protein
VELMLKNNLHRQLLPKGIAWEVTYQFKIVFPAQIRYALLRVCWPLLAKISEQHPGKDNL